ncbi:hypothetical protein ACFYZ6_34115 [Streptomyces rubiginosohelvolus]|uniref:hypothetical protein n=1 Tax=Streptomyces rubiginosohelvolus TaxID=67362 RepID=UPI0036C914AB
MSDDSIVTITVELHSGPLDRQATAVPLTKENPLDRLGSALRQRRMRAMVGPRSHGRRLPG